MMKTINQLNTPTKRWQEPTKGTWFAAYGCVYSQLGDGSVVRVATMDRDESGTSPTERDANVRLIVKMQNENVMREITPENYKQVLKQIE